MRVILEVVEGPREGRSFIFDRHDTFIVGRSRSVHCPVPEDAALSRDHFIIEINPPQCELRDLGSTNGTFVNNQRVDRVRLSSGDVIAAGQSVFRVKVESDQSISSGDDLSSSKSRAETSVLGQIRCEGCGAPAPQNLNIAGPVSSSTGEAVEWWCALCRSEAASLPQPVPYYTTLRELGRGAMGVVYQARHNL